MFAGIVIIAVAQSGAPGATPDYGEAAELHPLPPLPYQVRSPMPSLPPPGGSTAPGETAAPPQPRAGMWPNGDGTYTGYLPGLLALVDSEGRVMFSDESSFEGDAAAGQYGAFGYLGRFSGLNGWTDGDPDYNAKQRFLEQSFEVRLEMRFERRADFMEAALRDLPRYLAAVWYYDAWPLLVRKRILFDLWDECAEHGDRSVADGGAAARAIIETFVRRYLPADSANAFTEDELRALNGERMSWVRFDPYAGGS